MTPRLPEGIPWPADGALDPALVEAQAGRPMSVYVHVPFCQVRCGYCDFNTYTVGFGPGAEPTSYADTVLAETALAARALREAGLAPRPAATVFFGGGTPTMLAPDQLERILAGIREHIGIAEGAEVTTEANPETVTRESLDALARAGFTRVSVGMQSAVPHVLATLDRQHRPERVPQVLAWAREAGLEVSVDLIYGTPGESLADWEVSLRAAIAMAPDHISAYALVIEEGTKMGALVARSELPVPDPDDEADKYELANELLGAGGYQWYEISNFARVGAGEEGLPSAQWAHASQHNLAYWRDWDWWGLGPGAHSHVGRVRWWNVKHPRAHAGRVKAGESPAAAGEILDSGTRELERILLGIRTRDGIAAASLARSDRVAELIADGLVEAGPALRGQVVLTVRGRLLADHVTRVLTSQD